MKLSLGDTTVDIVATPGHTPGTLSYIFPVKDQGRPVVVAYSGGTLTGAFGTNGAKWDEYVASQRRIAEAAAAAGATVILSNHSEYDGAYTKARLLLAPRQPGETHPFVVGADGVQRYFKVMAECAMAAKLRAGAKWSLPTMWQQNYAPIAGSLGLSALVAAVPVLVLFV